MHETISAIIKKHFLFFIFIIFYAGAIGYKLIAQPTPFFDWDESLYVQTGKEMLQNNYFFFPVWQGIPWLDKPPLIPLLYGLVMKIFFFIPSEISTRLFTLIIALIVLTLIYTLCYRTTQNKFVSWLSTALTAFTPIFFQRSQVVNLDMFLLLGWLGYVLFYEHFFAGLFFLFVAVFSKSLIGFYAPAVVSCFYIYLFFTKKISFFDLKEKAKKIGMQTAILLTWFIAMLLIFKDEFWKQHIIESHFRRVTSSIEFHFGQRTFYIDLAREQFGMFFWIALIGLILTIILYFKKEKKLLYSLFLFPWFMFLNLTKTKIFWYFYAAIPQFAFLAAAPLEFFKKKKIIYIALSIFLIGTTVYQSFVKQNIFANVYSRYEPHYYLATYAKENCKTLHILMNETTRNDFATLENMGLLITTTKWWGNHPSIVYYAEKPVFFYYDKNEFINKLPRLAEQSCVSVESADLDVQFSAYNFTQTQTFGNIYVFRSRLLTQ